MILPNLKAESDRVIIILIVDELIKQTFIMINPNWEK